MPDFSALALPKPDPRRCLASDKTSYELEAIYRFIRLVLKTMAQIFKAGGCLENPVAF